MEKFLKFLKNRWFLFGISFLSVIYVLFVGNMVRITFTCHLEINNFTSMMALYLLINFLFGVLMFFTRKQIPTIICAILIPIEAFALMITAFGQWYLIIPPAVVGMFAFLMCGVAESCKTVMGTLFLLMFVVGGLVYNVFMNFGISLFYVITDLQGHGIEVDMEERSSDYLNSPDGTYRLVKYIDNGDNGRSVTGYYVEPASQDEEYPFVYCYRVYGCRHVLSTLYDSDINPRWISDSVLFIDGRQRDMEELFSDNEEDNEDDKDDADDTEDTEDTKDTKDTEDTEDTGETDAPSEPDEADDDEGGAEE